MVRRSYGSNGYSRGFNAGSAQSSGYFLLLFMILFGISLRMYHEKHQRNEASQAPTEVVAISEPTSMIMKDGVVRDGGVEFHIWALVDVFHFIPPELVSELGESPEALAAKLTSGTDVQIEDEWNDDKSGLIVKSISIVEPLE